MYVRLKINKLRKCDNSMRKSKNMLMLYIFDIVNNVVYRCISLFLELTNIFLILRPCLGHIFDKLI